MRLKYIIRRKRVEFWWNNYHRILSVVNNPQVILTGKQRTKLNESAWTALEKYMRALFLEYKK